MRQGTLHVGSAPRRRSQLPSAAAKMHDFVQRRHRSSLAKTWSRWISLVGELSEEAVTAGNIAGDPMIVDLSVDEQRDQSPG